MSKEELREKDKFDKEVFQEKNLLFGAVVFLLLASVIFNQFTLNSINTKMAGMSFAGGASSPSSNVVGSSAVSGSSAGAGQSSASLQQAWSEIAPKGVPSVYGAELGVSYDKAAEAMPLMYKYDDYLGSQKINLTADEMQRYIAITNSISCEYCCGAPAITTKDGSPACACAHSAAMRGLAKYLLDKHADMSDEAILSELGKWKVLFFPANSVQKAAALKSNSLPTDYISLSSNKYRGIQSKAVSSQTQSGSSGQSGLPAQVGGC